MNRYFPLEEYTQRWERVQEAMRRESLDLVLVWSRSAGTYDRCADLLYLANYYGNQPGQGRRGPQGFAALLLKCGETPELFADVLDPRTDLVSTEHVHACANTFEAVAQGLTVLGRRRVGLVGSDVIPMKYWPILQRLAPDIEWVITDELIRQVRLVKSARELDAFRQAGEVVSGALGALMRALAAGSSEAEAAGDAAREVYRGGGHVHMLAISHGANLQHLASDPLVGYSQDRPKHGDLVRAWITGPMFQGYWLGPGRTVVSAASPTPAQRSLLEANTAAVGAIIGGVRAGVSVRELVAIGDRHTEPYVDETNLMAQQWPLYGHGNGLFFEAPTISTRVGPDADFVLRENMVISIEVFLSQTGVGHTGFENNIIVTATGSELLSRTPMML
ncbi:MAG: M24 family metallopeptidase [Steroidobacteraceae bacterium]